MAIFLDLDDDIHDPDAATPTQGALTVTQPPRSQSDKDEGDGNAEDRPNPNINGFSAALRRYPVVEQLASLIDLNTLDALSKTCRQFRANLLDFRSVSRLTLRCVNERPRQHEWECGVTSGPMGLCARDMVGECDRCARVVCRNCTIKPPPSPVLKGRHRRLCSTCKKAPLHILTAPCRPRSARSNSSSSSSSPHRPVCEPVECELKGFTAPAFQRTPCACEERVWLCKPCGSQLKTADTLYKRSWNWRTKYSYYLGGAGAGAGEGIEGVECGRGPSCLAARTVEQEVECDPDTFAEVQEEAAQVQAEGTGRNWHGTCYKVQEIEGFGGAVQRKVKRHVLVGDVVKIYKDEEERMLNVLEREVSGNLRSWCSWCQRVIPSEKDLEEPVSSGPKSEEGAVSNSGSS